MRYGNIVVPYNEFHTAKNTQTANCNNLVDIKKIAPRVMKEVQPYFQTVQAIFNFPVRYLILVKDDWSAPICDIPINLTAMVRLRIIVRGCVVNAFLLLLTVVVLTACSTSIRLFEGCEKGGTWLPTSHKLLV